MGNTQSGPCGERYFGRSVDEWFEWDPSPSPVAAPPFNGDVQPGHGHGPQQFPHQPTQGSWDPNAPHQPTGVVDAYGQQAAAPNDSTHPNSGVAGTPRQMAPMPLGTQSDGQMTVANLHDAGLSGQNMPMEYHVQQQLVPSNNARAHYDGSGSQIAINNPSVLGTPSEEMVERIQAPPILSYPILSDLIRSDPIRSDTILSDLIRSDLIRSDLIQSYPIWSDPPKSSHRVSEVP